MARAITITLSDAQEQIFDETTALIHLQGTLMGEPVEKITAEDIVKAALLLFIVKLNTGTIKA